MKPSCLLFATLALLASTGCKRHPESGHNEEAGHGHAEAGAGEADAHGHSHGHEEEAEAPSGASYKKGKGVLVKDATKKLLGLATTEVAEKPLARRVEFVVQAVPSGSSPARWLATGTAPRGQLTGVQAGQEVALRADDGATFTGRVKALDESLGRIHGEVEVVVEFNGPATAQPSVTFLHATLTLPTAKAALVVPKSAVLRTAAGTFVYAVNGDAYQRTAVKTGAEADGFIEVTDGLLEGDAVVVKPVEALYLVELRAVKGGGHSH